MEMEEIGSTTTEGSEPDNNVRNNRHTSKSKIINTRRNGGGGGVYRHMCTSSSGYLTKPSGSRNHRGRTSLMARQVLSPHGFGGSIKKISNEVYGRRSRFYAAPIPPEDSMRILKVKKSRFYRNERWKRALHWVVGVGFVLAVFTGLILAVGHLRSEKERLFGVESAHQRLTNSFYGGRSFRATSTESPIATTSVTLDAPPILPPPTTPMSRSRSSEVSQEETSAEELQVFEIPKGILTSTKKTTIKPTALPIAPKNTGSNTSEVRVLPPPNFSFTFPILPNLKSGDNSLQEGSSKQEVTEIPRVVQTDHGYSPRDGPSKFRVNFKTLTSSTTPPTLTASPPPAHNVNYSNLNNNNFEKFATTPPPQHPQLPQLDVNGGQSNGLDFRQFLQSIGVDPNSIVTSGSAPSASSESPPSNFDFGQAFTPSSTPPASYHPQIHNPGHQGGHQHIAHNVPFTGSPHEIASFAANIAKAVVSSKNFDFGNLLGSSTLAPSSSTSGEENNSNKLEKRMSWAPNPVTGVMGQPSALGAIASLGHQFSSLSHSSPGVTGGGAVFSPANYPDFSSPHNNFGQAYFDQPSTDQTPLPSGIIPLDLASSYIQAGSYPSFQGGQGGSYDFNSYGSTPYNPYLINSAGSTSAYNTYGGGGNSYGSSGGHGSSGGGEYNTIAGGMQLLSLLSGKIPAELQSNNNGYDFDSSSGSSNVNLSPLFSSYGFGGGGTYPHYLKQRSYPTQDLQPAFSTAIQRVKDIPLPSGINIKGGSNSKSHNYHQRELGNIKTQPRSPKFGRKLVLTTRRVVKEVKDDDAKIQKSNGGRRGLVSGFYH